MTADYWVVLGLAAFFGLFTFMMSATSCRYIFLNVTTVEILKRETTVYQLAIRVARGTPRSEAYETVTYPLPKPQVNGTSVHSSPDTSVRDDMATRTFAIVRTEMSENPWDLGYYNNWKQIMGDKVWDWFLPIHRSPCCDHRFKSDQSAYPLGPLYTTLRERFGLGFENGDGIELR